ncbi:MAG: MBL fold metallo-hydrolase [Candidatus Magasanikbacteria bacterium]|nr:MBL fold metallo-hydrolase [Candidatus Magasanikbacteria bacterium]
MRQRGFVILIIVIFIVFDVFLWRQILFSGPNKNTELYFLDVGQGDSQLVILPGGVKILIDGGPDKKVLDGLAAVLRPTDRYIDLAVLSHPQTDHFTGLIDILKRYKVGVFVSSGGRGSAQSFADLEKVIAENKIPGVTLARGDRIKYEDNNFDILSPSPALLESDEPNDWGLVMRLETSGMKALFTGDIDSRIEEELVQEYDMDIDVLKVAHHGSKFSSSVEFLRAATPQIAFIEVGKNTYGHPTKDALERLAAVGAQIFRADQNGTIKIEVADSKIKVFTKK